MYDRWRKHKQIIREASEVTAQRCLNKVVRTNAEKLQVLIQAARAVCVDQPHMIKKAIASSPDLDGIVGIDQYGHASIKAPSRFQAIIAT